MSFSELRAFPFDARNQKRKQKSLLVDLEYNISKFSEMTRIDRKHTL
jgi:hypothetical protein